MKKVSNKDQLISVIVPVYNVEKYLKKCIDSIINQTYKNLEIILVDDGSLDKCPIICDEYAKKDKRIKVIHQSNAGLSAARNIGIKNANGKYIGFVDSDDWIEPNMYEIMYDVINKTGCDLVDCQLHETSDRNCKMNNKNFNIQIYDVKDYLERYFKIKGNRTCYYATTKLYKKQYLSNNQYPIGLTSEDVVGSFKYLIKCKKIACIDSKLYYYFKNKNGITGNFSRKDFDLLEIWDKMLEISPKEYFEMVKLNRYRIDFTLLIRMALNLKYSIIISEYNDYYISCLTNCKKHKNILLKSTMPLSRKIALMCICINYKLFCNVAYFLKRMI